MMRLVCIVLVLMMPLTGAGQRLLNPSFEDEGVSLDRAAGWSWWGDWINRETGWTPTRDGTCLIGYHHWEIEKNASSGLYQDLTDVEPGAYYEFSVYANTDSVGGSENSARSVDVRLETTLYGEQSMVASKKYKVSDIATGEGWSRLRVRATAPNDTLRVLIIVEPSETGPRGGALKFDQAELKKLPRE